MIKNSKHIKHLYQKYLDHSVTDREFDQLFNYLKNPENLELLKQEMSREWQSNDQQDRLSPLYWDEIEMEIRKRKALERKKALERENRRYWWAAAASALVIIGLSISIYFSGTGEDYLTYTTTYGEVQKIVLDDGSQVTLNANSILKWKRNWKGEGKRIAILDGEAYFNVETIRDDKNHKKTGFDVQTDDLTIQVVGTAFNVNSRTEKTDVFLDEGMIHLDLLEPDKILNIEKKKPSLIMNPGESVSYSAKTKILERAENNQYGNASWMAGTFMYTNKSVRDILKSLEDIYGVTFNIQDSALLQRKLTTHLPYSDWPIVQSALELLLQCQLEKTNDEIRIKTIKKNSW